MSSFKRQQPIPDLRPDLMAPTRRKVAEKAVCSAFGGLNLQNPLLRLRVEDKILLWALLKVIDSRKHGSVQSDIDNLFEEVRQTAKDAAALANRIENVVFSGPVGQILNGKPMLCFRDLPKLLTAYADQLRELMSHTGKSGHTKEAFGNMYLVVVSEFLKLKTGSYNDDHLADLGQQIGEIGGGESIRKRRALFKRTYPAAYAFAVQKALSFHKSTYNTLE